MFITDQMCFGPWEFADSYICHNYQWCYPHEMLDSTRVYLYGA